jgi:diguanylate cyclase (GGDEF)-like protein
MIRSRVLVVDDDGSTRMAVRMALEADGLEVIEAADGFAALERFEVERPDLVVLDMLMPGIDGFATCRALRAHPFGAVTPVLVTTGLDDLAAIERAYAAGATDFATKPVSLFVLRQRIQYMLRVARDQAALRASEYRLREAERLAHVGHWEWDVERDELLVSEEARSILGLGDGPDARARLLATVKTRGCRDGFERALERVLSTNDVTNVEYIAVGEPERFVVQRFVATAARGGRALVRGTVQDVTERKRAESTITELAFLDGVTGLPNRAFLLRSLARLCARDGRIAGRILSIDLDGFKRINDSWGHGAGDALLAEVGRRILRSVDGDAAVAGRSSLDALDDGSQTTARFGGDEFVVVLPGANDADAAVIAERILASLATPIAVGTSEAFVSASVGIAEFAPGSDVENVLQQADAAMYQAKLEGRGRWERYTTSLAEAARTRAELETDLHKAIARGELEVHYQPKVDARTLQVRGFEALVRWRHPTRGMVSPLEFISIAEESSLILEIGEIVLRTACRDLVALRARWGPLCVAVNVSARQFRDARFVDVVRRSLEETGLPPAALELEITEGTLMEDFAIDALTALKKLGVMIALDDFGTGYSSLGYLRRFPLDVVKVDRSFVRDVATDPDAAAIVAAILALAHRLRLSVVAEGVETAEHVAFLREQGCSLLQGYLFSPPLPRERLERWLARSTAPDGRSSLVPLGSLPPAA